MTIGPNIVLASGQFLLSRADLSEVLRGVGFGEALEVTRVNEGSVCLSRLSSSRPDTVVATTALVVGLVREDKLSMI